MADLLFHEGSLGIFSHIVSFNGFVEGKGKNKDVRLMNLRKIKFFYNDTNPIMTAY